MASLDDVMNDLDELEEKKRSGTSKRAVEIEDMEDAGQSGRVPIGTVEHYYGRLGVAAVRLTDRLSIGDTIEVKGGDPSRSVREIVSSMQINRRDVMEAYGGDSVGIALANPVAEGSKVYRLA